MKRLSSLAALGLMLSAAPAFAQQTPGTPDLPATVQPDADEDRGYEASVSEVIQLRHQGNGPNDLDVHLYGTTGGDPAMNGFYAYIAFWQSPQEGHRVFRIGDFSGFRLVSETKGNIVLEITESTMTDAGDLGSRTRRIAVSWTPGADGAVPASIRISAAPTR